MITTIVYAIALTFFAPAGFTAKNVLSEKQKIELLLEQIENSDCTFIRNGTEYPAAKAREHLETKLSKSWISIDTADKFIKYIASKSYLSGKPYYVRLKNGKTIKAGKWFKTKLREIEKKKPLNK